jgi:hypothetical protein
VVLPDIWLRAFEALGFGGARLTVVFRAHEVAWLKMHVGLSLGTQKGSVEVAAGPRNQILKAKNTNQTAP